MIALKKPERFDNYEQAEDIIFRLEAKLVNLTNNLDKKTAEAILSYKSSQTYNKEKTLSHLVSNLESAFINIDLRMIKHSDKSVHYVAKEISEKIKNYMHIGYNLNATDFIRLFYAIDNDAIQAPCITYDLNGAENQNIKLITSPSWWKKNLSSQIRQNREQIKKITGMIGKTQLYVSDVALAEQKNADKKLREFLANKAVISKETGEEFFLKSLEKKDQRKFSEIYCILNGADKYAIKHNLDTAMITITLPPEYHYSSASVNHKTPAEGGKLLLKNWSSCTKAFSKLKDFYFAFRITDLHKDGTPHLHILIHFNNELRQQYKSIIEKHFCHNGFNEQSVHWLDIDREKGTFIGYIVKSLLPSNGSIDSDIADIERISTARRLWRLRSHSITGLTSGCVAVWRELRKHMKYKTTDNDVSRIISHIKKNNFYDFLIEFQKGNITPIYSIDRKIIGANVYNEPLTKRSPNENEQKNGKLIKNEKVNINNYSSNIGSVCKDFGCNKKNSANDDSFVINTAKSIWHSEIKAMPFLARTASIFDLFKDHLAGIIMKIKNYLK